MNSTRIELQPAYVIHTRHYRDSSLIVDFITPDFGKVSVVAKGVRAASKSAKQKRSLFQPFIPLLISWGGKGELKTLFHIESTPGIISVQGERLFSALYVNELLCRLLKAEDESTEIYSLYQAILQRLSGNELLEPVLRQFELQLLILLGYGLSLDVELDSGMPIRAEGFYQFIPGQGFKPSVSRRLGLDVFEGAHILSLAHEDYNQASLSAAKRLCRLAIAFYLGGKPLKSRELFVKPSLDFQSPGPS